MSKKSCKNCTHFIVCKIISRLVATLKRHVKAFKPSSLEGPTEKIYKVVGGECVYFQEKEK